MTGDINYAHGAIRSAIRGMAISDEPLRARLAEAWRSLLVRISEDDLPEEAHEDFRALAAGMAKDPSDDDECRRLAGLLCDVGAWTDTAKRRAGR